MLNTYDPEKFLIQDHYDEVIESMEALAEKIWETAKDLRGDLFEITDESYDLIRHIDFGLFKDLEGYVSKIFENFNFSGVEIKVDLPIRKTCSDCC